MTTISERMQKKAEAAREEVRRLLWTGADPDKVADAAISGGLSGDEVDRIEKMVAEGKAAIERLAAFDVPALKSGADEKRTEAERLEKKLEKLTDETDRAQIESETAAAALEEAIQAHRQIAMGVRRGEIPADGLPAAIGAIIESERLSGEIQAAETKRTALLREIKKGETRKTIVEAEAEKLSTNNQTPEYSVRMRPLVDEYEASAKTLGRRIEEARKRVAEIDKTLADLRARQSKARELLPW
jgi:hypothetical protein